MAIDCSTNKNDGAIAFAESICSDGMCCFTCVVPADNGHVGFLRYFLEKRNGFAIRQIAGNQ